MPASGSSRLGSAIPPCKARSNPDLRRLRPGKSCSVVRSGFKQAASLLSPPVSGGLFYWTKIFADVVMRLGIFSRCFQNRNVASSKNDCSKNRKHRSSRIQKAIERDFWSGSNLLIPYIVGFGASNAFFTAGNAVVGNSCCDLGPYFIPAAALRYQPNTKYMEISKDASTIA